MSNVIDAIAAQPWSRYLTAEQRRRVVEDVLVRAVPKGGSVCRQAETVRHWIGVVEGLIKVAKTSAAGKITTFSLVQPCDWFGEESLLKQEPLRYEAIALRDSQVAYLPQCTFCWLLDGNVRFSRFVLEHVNERLFQALGAIEVGRLTRANGKLAHCLADLFGSTRDPGGAAALQLSQQEIGDLAGLSRQVVNHALKVLRQAGLVRVEYGRIAILDVDGLRRFDG